MAVLITSDNKEKLFTEKDFIIIGSNSDCDFQIDLGFDFILTVQYSEKTNNCTVLNNFSNPNILFCGKPLIEKLVVDKVCKLKINGSRNFIGIKIVQNQHTNCSASNITEKELTAAEVQELYGSGINTAVRIKLENRKTDIERNRIAITKQIAFAITDLKKRISHNFKASIILNIGLFLSAVITTFGISNYLLGLPIGDTIAFLNMPFNIKILVLFSVLTFGILLTLKQGSFLFLQNKDIDSPARSAIVSQNFLIVVSVMFLCAFYTINLIYYSNPNGKIVFGSLISLFFTGLSAALSIICGYFKYSGHKMALELDKYEYREDFEIVINEYQSWIEMFINSNSNVKINYIKDKLFMLHLKGLSETILGILTAPFLAYGVSNTLAMCFPEAAGWIRISGLRFSPVFLVLASMLIIFAFFTITNAFTNIRKLSGSDIIKLDGFRNYLLHGVDIFGLENIRSIKTEKTRLFVIGLSIIFIEFTLNTTFFMTEIGADLKGLFLSLIAALVPTALLIAETYILSKTNYEIFVCDSFMSKLDRK